MQEEDKDRMRKFGCNLTYASKVEKANTKSLILLKAADTKGKLQQSFNVDDQMLWGETVDGCIQSARVTIGRIDIEHTIVAPVNAL